MMDNNNNDDDNDDDDDDDDDDWFYGLSAHLTFLFCSTAEPFPVPVMAVVFTKIVFKMFHNFVL